MLLHPTFYRNEFNKFLSKCSVMSFKKSEIAIQMILLLCISFSVPVSSNWGGHSNIGIAISSISTNVAIDGQIEPGEYAGWFLLDSASDFYLHYAINGSVIYFAMEADALGYLAIGIGYSSKMQDSDIYIGYVDGNGAHMSDNWGTGSVSHVADTENNILEFAGSENSTSTVIEFSRALDTGDASQDNIITLGVQMDLIWAYHSTADDFTSYHSARWYATATFSTHLPSPPSGVSGLPGDRQVTLTWSAPIDGGDPISEYRVYFANNSGGPYSLAGSSSATSLVVSDLTNAQIHYFVVTAVNGIGESAYSTEIAVIPSGTVSPPQNLTATAFSSRVELTWQPPLSDGGGVLQKYFIYRSLTSGSGFELLGENTTSLGFTDTDVVNGITYFYYVTAFNGFKESDPSGEVSATPKGEPTEPLNLESTLSSSNTILLNWSAPLSDGGFIITEYRIYRADISGGPYVLIGTNDSKTGFEDSSVVNLATYYYAVAAVNSFGEGAKSNELRVKVARVPFRITNVSIASDFNRVDLNWTAPNDNGYPILYYLIYRSNSIEGSYSLVGNVTGLSYTDNRVANQETYYYRVSAVNSQGEGRLSDPVSVTVGGVPRAPIDVAVSPGLSQVRLSWDFPLIDGGYPVIQFTVYRSLDNLSFVPLINLTEVSYVDSNVSNGVEYYYRISAWNVLGEGLLSQAVAVVPGGPPGSPWNLTANFDGLVISLTWSIPNVTFGYPILTYLVYRSSDGGSNYHFLSNSSATSFIDNSFLFGVEYRYFVTAVTALGEGNASTSVSIVSATRPLPPQTLLGRAVESTVVLQWSRPAFDGGSQILGYRVYLWNDTGYLLIGNTTDLTFVHANLSTGVNYRYVVTAYNEMGESDFSSPLDVSVVLKTPLIVKKAYETFIDFGEIFVTVGVFLGAGSIFLSTVAVLRLPKPRN